MSEQEKLLENLKYQLDVRYQTLHLTVIYEDDFLRKIGKRNLEIIRDETLDLILDLRYRIKTVENNLKKSKND